MKLKNLEKDIEIMEQTLAKMKNLTKEVEALDDQVDTVRNDLEVEQYRGTPTKKFR